MKLTKSKLKQIIKEELEGVLNETQPEIEVSSEESPKPASKYQPYPPGPIEKRIRKLEAMVWDLFEKVTGPPMTDEERAEWAKNIQGELPPVREGHDHPGQTCAQAHPNITHEQYEEGREASLKLTIK
tara:strand:+ start:96 stop:479 length:384 start_codon:yes stop_codon:yes gene_type:complete